MANKLYQESSIQDIADAIREKNRGSAKYTVAQMGNAIRALASGEPTVQYPQSNTVAQAFVNEVVYDSSDYTTSQVANYVNQSTAYDKTKPFGVGIVTPAGRVVVADSYSDIVYEKDVAAGTNTLYNIIPNAEGSDYAVVASDEIVQSGHLIPTGSLRQIQCTTSNVRDLGGWACDGGKVKYGMLYRGGEFNPADVDIFFNQLGIRHELNLRGKTEAEEHYAQQVAAGNVTMRDYVRVTIPENYVWYTIADLYKDSWRDILRCVFNCAKYDEPVYFHCSAGADRTGTVACIIEAILGVSQSDIDKEYELTNFSSGVDGDSKARRRNESEWKGLITQISNLTTGSTFRDKVLNWVVTLGFTADEINAFRKSMIDGNPADITVDVDTYTVTNTLSNVTTSNSATTAMQYQAYLADIKPNEGYIIDSVKVVMGGKDVTASVWDGSETLLRYAITKNLTNCVISSSIGNAINAGYAYSATLSANEGYTLEKATVTIKMGGVDVSSSYADGKILIQEVTGDIVITAAIEVATITNLFVPSAATINARLSSSGTNSAMDGWFATDFIPVTLVSGNKFYIKNPLDSNNTFGAGGLNKVHYYNASKANLGAAILVKNPPTTNNVAAVTVSNGVASFNAGEKNGAIDSSLLAAKYVRLALQAGTSSTAANTKLTSTSQLDGVVITLNQPIKG